MIGKWTVRSDGEHLWRVIDPRGHVVTSWSAWGAAMDYAETNVLLDSMADQMRSAKRYEVQP